MLRSRLLKAIVRRVAPAENLAIVLAPHGASMLSIDLAFKPPPLKPAPGAGAVPHQLQTSQVRKNMLRDKSEPASQTVDRIRMLLLPRSKAKVAKADLLKMCPPAKVVGADDKEIDLSSSNADVWRIAKKLIIGSEIVDIHFNLPTVTGLSAPQVVYSGIPIVCSQIRLLFATKGDLEVQWVLGPKPKKGISTDRQGDALPPPEPSTEELAARPVLSDQLVLIPKQEWEGHALVFRCRPVGGLNLWSETETPPVQPPKVLHRPMPRWEKVATPEPDELRVVSYNLLHDGFCSTQWAMTQIYPFATEAVLDINFRRGRIVQELIKYDADIVCLQECGKDVYEKYFLDVFRALGYTASLALKNGTANEGVAFAFRNKRVEMLHKERVSLGWTTLQERHPNLASDVSENYPQLLEALKKLPSVGLIGLFRDKKTSKAVAVANTHLYFHSLAGHIRMLQFYVLANALEAFAMRHDTTRTVLLGDMNFSRPTGGYRLATKGSIGKDDATWQDGMKFYWGMSKMLGIGAQPGEYEADGSAPIEVGEGGAPTADGDEEFDVDDEDVKSGLTAGDPHDPDSDAASGVADQDFDVKSEARKQRQPPESLSAPPTRCLMADLQLPRPYNDAHKAVPDKEYITNFTLYFKEGIDHIFHSNDVTVRRTLPLPPLEEATEEVALPSSVFPSDHIALVVDVALLGDNIIASKRDDDSE